MPADNDLRRKLDRLGARRELSDEDKAALRGKTLEVIAEVRAQDPKAKDIVTMAEAARRLGISRQALYELADDAVAA